MNCPFAVKSAFLKMLVKVVPIWTPDHAPGVGNPIVMAVLFAETEPDVALLAPSMIGRGVPLPVRVVVLAETGATSMPTAERASMINANPNLFRFLLWFK